VGENENHYGSSSIHQVQARPSSRAHSGTCIIIVEASAEMKAVMMNILRFKRVYDSNLGICDGIHHGHEVEVDISR
jgi:hypothetical protein